MKTGKHGEYFWLVSDEALWWLHDLVVEYHYGLHLGITSFDSGPITPNKSELKLGWVFKDGVMVSPPLQDGVTMPHDQYDEWYISKELCLISAGLEVFVNYGGFTLVPPEESYKGFDPTWEKGTLDHLVPLQERFWAQISRTDPQTYVAIGDKDIVVSKSQQFINSVWQKHVRA